MNASTLRARKQRGYVLLGVVLTLLMAAAIAYQIGRESALNVTTAVSETQAVQARHVAEAGLALAAARLNASGACSAIPAGTPITGQMSSGDSFSVTSSTVSTNPLTLKLTSTPTLNANGQTYAPLSKQIVVYTGVEQQRTIYRNASGVVADTFIARAVGGGLANGNKYNFGADPVLILDNGGKVTNILLRFDLVGALPAAAQLKAARLVLTPVAPWGNVNDTTDVTVHEMTRGWPEGAGTLAVPTLVSSGATWDQPVPSVATWGFVRYLAPGSTVSTGVASGGGDYDPAYVASAYMDSGAIAATYSWDVTPLAAQWLASPAGNSGMLLKSEQGLVQAKFASSEDLNKGKRPQLVLTYLLPCGGPSITLSTLDTATAKPILVATVSTPIKLRIDIANSMGAAANVGGAFTVTLPPNTSVASPPAASTANCGGMTFLPLAGDTTLTLLGGSIPAAAGTAPGVCSISVAISVALPSGSATLASGPSGTATTLTIPAGQLVTSQGSNAAAATTSWYAVPLPTLAADTFIYAADSLTNYGSQTSMQQQNNASMRTLVRFSGLPPNGVPVQSATLRLFMRSIWSPGLVTNIALQPYLVTTAWNEATTTWARSSGWGTAGGDYATTPALTAMTLTPLTIPVPFVGTWVVFDVTPAANAWGGGTANNGLILISTTPAISDQDRLYPDSKERASGSPAQLQMTY